MSRIGIDCLWDADLNYDTYIDSLQGMKYRIKNLVGTFDIFSIYYSTWNILLSICIHSYVHWDLSLGDKGYISVVNYCKLMIDHSKCMQFAMR